MTIESPISILVNNELTLKNVDTVGYKQEDNKLYIEFKSKLFRKLNFDEIDRFFKNHYKYKHLKCVYEEHFYYTLVELIFEFEV